MSSYSLEALPAALAQFLPSQVCARVQRCQQVYASNRDRIYSFAFWMTDSEPEAEALSLRTFVRAFSLHDEPSAEAIDRALVRELRNTLDITFGPLSLLCPVVTEVAGIRRNTLRVELERAILRLPYTERMIFCMHDGDGYGHERIARTLGLSEDDSRQGLFAARLRIRELVQASSARAVA